ncbi:MAG: nucleotide exchange factor GrpE [Actinomycetaceae bacterium]|nr:nucleotide exchange factor GrpE [Actinomycetaceae bacterium]
MTNDHVNPNPNADEDRDDVTVGASNQAPTGPSGENRNDPNAPQGTQNHDAGNSEDNGANQGGDATVDTDATGTANAESASEEIDPDDISHLEEQLADVDSERDADDLAEAREEMAKLADDLARARADHYNLNQQYNNYVRRSKTDVAAARKRGHDEVVEALMPVLDDIEAARQAGALTDGPFAAIASKLEQTLASRFEFERFGEVDEPFDPMLHEAVMATPSADVEVETVLQVIQGGYRVGDKVVRPAKVIVANPQ